MEKELSPIAKVSMEVIQNKIYITALRELLVEKGVITDAEYQAKVLSIMGEKRDILVDELFDSKRS